MFNNAKSDQPAENKIVVVISSDKGLCGGIHSSVTKATRKIFAAAPDAPLKTELAPETPIFIIGDKSKGAAELYDAKSIKREEWWSKKYAPSLVKTRYGVLSSRCARCSLILL